MKNKGYKPKEKETQKQVGYKYIWGTIYTYVSNLSDYTLI